MNIVSSPALRPSHPHGCRERAFHQGQALRGRFAGLDLMPLFSGYGYSRVTDEEASGGGSVKGSPQTESTKTKKAFPAAHGFPAYRHAGITILAQSPRLAFLRVLPIHALRPPARRSDARVVMCIILTIVCAGY